MYEMSSTIHMRSLFLIAVSCLFALGYAQAQTQTPLITDIAARKATSLNGTWQYIIDPYGTGFYDYRYMERRENDREAYWTTDEPVNKTERKEHKFTDKY